MKTTITTIFSILLLAFANAQTNPTPFDLSVGNYSFTQWPSTSAAGTYPANMVFHCGKNPSGATFDATLPGTQDWNCAYNLTTRNRILGEETSGVSFLATSSSQFSDCVSTYAGDSSSRFVGSAVLSLNTLLRNNVQVSYTGGTITAGDGTPTPRQFTFVLQYRIGNTGNFTDVGTAANYLSSTTGSTQNIGPIVLPVACENEAEVQVRWVYYQIAANNGGSRPKMSLDEITVTSDITTAITELKSANNLLVYPNPVNKTQTIALNKIISGTIINTMGSTVYTIKNNNEIPAGTLESGVFYLITTDGVAKKIIINN